MLLFSFNTYPSLQVLFFLLKIKSNGFIEFYFKIQNSTLSILFTVIKLRNCALKLNL